MAPSWPAAFPLEAASRMISGKLSADDPKETDAILIRLSLIPVLLVLAACENEVELSSIYCAEIERGATDEAIRESHFTALDSLFDELRFQPDDHLGSHCVKSFWGKDSKATINVCTGLTIVTS